MRHKRGKARNASSWLGLTVGIRVVTHSTALDCDDSSMILQVHYKSVNYAPRAGDLRYVLYLNEDVYKNKYPKFLK